MNFSFYKPRVDSDHRCWQSCCQRGRCFPHPSSIPGNAESEPYVSSCQGFLHRGARFTGGSGTGRPRCSECTSSSACWSSFWGRVQLHLVSGGLGSYRMQRSSRAEGWDQEATDGRQVSVAPSYCDLAVRFLRGERAALWVFVSFSSSCSSSSSSCSSFSSFLFFEAGSPV